MPIPELVRRAAEKRIRDYCERRIPARIRNEMRLGGGIEGDALTLVARRRGRGTSRFRYEPRLGVWSLFWADRHGRWHRYGDTEPSLNVGPLLAEVDRDPMAIFWG